MYLDLYNTTDRNNTINKKLDIIEMLKINLNRETNMFAPLLILTKNSNIDYTKANYAILYNDYYNDNYYNNVHYFINSYNSINSKHYSIQLQEDVLETFKDDILNSQSEIIQKSQPDYSTTSLPATSQQEKLIYKSDKILDTTPSLVMITMGDKDQ